MLAACKMMIVVLPTGLVDRRNAAAALGRAPKTLANWSSQHVGPPCIRVRGRCFYNWTDVQDVGCGAEASAREIWPAEMSPFVLASPLERDGAPGSRLQTRGRRTGRH
jgi:hypothetical protein